MKTASEYAEEALIALSQVFMPSRAEKIVTLTRIFQEALDDARAPDKKQPDEVYPRPMRTS